MELREEPPVPVQRIRHVQDLEHGRLLDLHGEEIRVVVLHGVLRAHAQANHICLEAGRGGGDRELDGRFVGVRGQPQLRLLQDDGVQQ